MNLVEFREKYPMYDVLSDDELVTRMHKKFYADKMSLEDFSAKIEYSPVEVAEEPEVEVPPVQQQPFTIKDAINKGITAGEAIMNKLAGEAVGLDRFTQDEVEVLNIPQEEPPIEDAPPKSVSDLTMGDFPGTGMEVVRVGGFPSFDPEGSGYDYDTARKLGIKPDESGHWPSFDPQTGMLLKGKDHPTIDKTLAEELRLGNKLVQIDGRWYSRPKEKIHRFRRRPIERPEPLPPDTGERYLEPAEEKPLMERGVEAVERALGIDIKTAKEKPVPADIAAQSTIELLAKEEGVPVSEYRNLPPGGEPIRQLVDGAISVATLGLKDAADKTFRGVKGFEPSSPSEKVGSGLGQFIGLLLGPAKVSHIFTKPLLAKLPQAFEGTPIAIRTAKQLIREAVGLAPVIGVSATGEALERPTFRQAAQAIMDATESGLLTGAIFGMTRGLFPRNVQDRARRIITGWVTLNAQRILEDPNHTGPWDRPLEDVVFDTAMDTFFMWKGLPKQQFSQMAYEIDREIVGRPKEGARAEEIRREEGRAGEKRGPAERGEAEGGDLVQPHKEGLGTEAEFKAQEEAEKLESAYSGPERRTDLTFRKKVEEMTPEERAHVLLHDELTGLKNKRAFDEEYEAKPTPEVARLDMDNLHDINEVLTYEGGNELIKGIGEIARKNNIDLFREKGDEFIAKGTRAELEKSLKSLRDELSEVEVEYTTPDGDTYIKRGIGVSYGIGKNLAEAEKAQTADKDARVKAGLRGERGFGAVGLAQPIPERGKVETEEKDQFTAEDLELHPKETSHLEKIAMKQGDKIYAYKPGEDNVFNHADIMIKHKLDYDSAVDGFIDKKGNFVRGFKPEVEMPEPEIPSGDFSQRFKAAREREEAFDPEQLKEIDVTTEVANKKGIILEQTKKATKMLKDMSKNMNKYLKLRNCLEGKTP